MAPRTVSDIFGLKPEEVNALAIVSGLEGYRGASGKDVAAVAANLLNRRLHGGWGGRDIRNIATAPGQYEAIFSRKLSMKDLADPATGARLLGGPAQFELIRNTVNNAQLVGGEFDRMKGAQSFKGVSQYANRKPEDYTPVPGKSNFYHGTDPNVYKRGRALFGSQTPASSPGTTQAPPVATPREKGNNLGNTFLQSMIKSFVPALIRQRSEATTNPYEGVASLDSSILNADDELVSYLQGIS
jgi:hypothetical protein